MKIDDIEIITGGQFNLQETLENHTEYGNDGKKILHVTPELYEILKNEWSVEDTKALSENDIKRICNFYKNKYIAFPEEPYNEDTDPDEYVNGFGSTLYMDVVRVELDKETYEFNIFCNMLYIIREDSVFPYVGPRNEEGLVVISLPVEYNDAFINYKDKVNLVVDDYQFLEVVDMVNDELAFFYNKGVDIMNKIVSKSKPSAKKKTRRRNNTNNKSDNKSNTD